MKKVLILALAIIPAQFLHAEKLKGQKSLENPLIRQQFYTPAREQYIKKGFIQVKPQARGFIQAKPQAQQSMQIKPHEKPPAKPPREACVFCDDIEAHKDHETFLITRFKHNAIFLNIYPYQRGHLLVIPSKHVKALSQMGLDARQEMMEILAAIPEIFSEALGAQGTNIGINLGKIAGTSKPDHLHVHALPRFGNEKLGFIELIGETTVVQWDLHKLYAELKPYFDALKERLY